MADKPGPTPRKPAGTVNTPARPRPVETVPPSAVKARPVQSAPPASAPPKPVPQAAPKPKPVPEAQPAAAARHPLPYWDIACVLGTLAVVLGHICDMVVFDKRAAELDWWVCNVVDSASRWAVPVFVMLLGARLLGPERSEKSGEFYRKRLWHLGIPLVVWSAFFMVLSVRYTGWQTWDTAVNDLIRGKPYAHLQLIFLIMGLYAFTPMVRVFIRHASRQLLAVTVVILFFVAAGDSVLDGLTGSEQSVFLRFIPFIGYYLAGYLLRDRKLSMRAARGCWLLALTCLLTLAGGTGVLVNMFGLKPFPSAAFLLYDFTSPVRIAFAVAAWLILVNTFDQRWFESKLSRLLSRWLAPATLGIYLVHPAFREILYVNGFDVTWPNVWLGVPLIAALVYVPSVVFTLIVMRIPLLRRIVG